ncbi:MAG: hypothetical protein ACRDAR_15960, partial [Aeromonas veronii]
MEARKKSQPVPGKTNPGITTSLFSSHFSCRWLVKQARGSVHLAPIAMHLWPEFVNRSCHARLS